MADRGEPVQIAIETREQADEAIAALSAWLHGEAMIANKAHPDEREPGIADVARDYCHQLLEAAHADGMSGCLLCQA